MQLGTCFINYEDFKEYFNAYKQETKSSYSIHSSTSVRSHNLKFGTDIRPDVIFTEVKYCCSTYQGHNGKRKPQDGVCPAYFLLQYDQELDRLVIKEECSTHIHSKKTNPPQASLSDTTQPEELLSSDSEAPSKKICNKGPSLSIKEEDVQEELQPDIAPPCEPQSNLSSETQDIGEGQSNTTSSNTTVPNTLAVDVVSRLDSFMRDFQKADARAKGSLTIGGQNELEQLGFQTSSMSSWFLKFPESLLLHRVSSKHGYTLYAFIVETKERLGKVVHFSFVMEENAKNISKMLKMLKHFNPEWAKVKIIYTDIDFRHVDMLKEAFPSTQVLISVYHTVRLIKKKIKGSADFKHEAHKCIDEAIYKTTTHNLNCLAQRLVHNLEPDLYAKLCQDWFSNELLWYMHVKKGIHSCSTYMDSIGLIHETISLCISRQSSMEDAIQEFLKSADCFNKALEKGGYPGFSKSAFKAPKNSAKKMRTLLPALEAPPLVSNDIKKKAIKQLKKTTSSNGLGPKTGGWRPVKLQNKMLLALREYCNDIGFQLCLKELEVVQESAHLMNSQPDFISVQILEQAHDVSLSGHTCTCYFQRDYKLPCRHILSMLHTYKRQVEEDMVSVRWRKGYVNPILDSRVYGKVFQHTQSMEETWARMAKITSLAKEFYNLLMQCDESEIQVRVSTLQMIVDMWRSDSGSMKPAVAQNEVSDFPYRWVKKEPAEEDDGSGYELCRVDHEAKPS
ncbi:hypothetical protein GDO81_012889 [Engystomops pustulosus]|uniref:SWIM-type domain-containing protein n=1 Tax=Engystomops pustulosus TaxID=76066 RepID=A0AAV7AVE8_ENGPU|nr:hypothetical protein GDO81_012889 [Engystomops pustulosus]KAG8565524.1 hypothetical protein GDO81_012889 [Engystomops pustulosus]